MIKDQYIRSCILFIFIFFTTSVWSMSIVEEIDIFSLENHLLDLPKLGFENKNFIPEDPFVNANLTFNPEIKTKISFDNEIHQSVLLVK